MFISPKDKLFGERFAFVFAVEPSKEKKSEGVRERSEAISNEVKLKIKFEDGKKPQK